MAAQLRAATLRWKAEGVLVTIGLLMSNAAFGAGFGSRREGRGRVRGMLTRSDNAR
jgi:hypothetical protein